MSSAASFVFAILLLPAAVAGASAQPQGAAAPASATPAAQPAQSVRPRVYTGLDIGFSGVMNADRVVRMAYPVVRAVQPDSPGEQAGVRAGDVIIEVDGRDSREDRILWLHPGVRYTLRLRSGQEEREVILVPLPRTEPPGATPAS